MIAPYGHHRLDCSCLDCASKRIARKNAGQKAKQQSGKLKPLDLSATPVHLRKYVERTHRSEQR
jgi:hypothetical protein